MNNDPTTSSPASFTDEARKRLLEESGATRFDRPNKPTLIGVGSVMVPEDVLMAMPEDQYRGMMTVFTLRSEATRRQLQFVEDHLNQTRSRLGALKQTASALPGGILKQGFEKAAGHVQEAVEVLQGLMSKDQA